MIRFNGRNDRNGFVSLFNHCTWNYYQIEFLWKVETKRERHKMEFKYSHRMRKESSQKRVDNYFKSCANHTMEMRQTMIQGNNFTDIHLWSLKCMSMKMKRELGQLLSFRFFPFLVLLENCFRNEKQWNGNNKIPCWK